MTAARTARVRRLRSRTRRKKEPADFAHFEQPLRRQGKTGAEILSAFNDLPVSRQAQMWGALGEQMAERRRKGGEQ